MKPFLIVYATREGHTHRIAEHLAAAFRARNLPVDVHEAGERRPPDLHSYSAAVLAASVHGGHHEPEMVRFVRAHRDELEQVPTTFLSVSLTEATVEDPSASEQRRADALRAVDEMVRRFLDETDWHPSRIRAVAGALLYLEYGRLIRFVMKRIARSAGGPTDTSKDYVFTDWAALDHLVDEIVSETGAVRGSHSTAEHVFH